MGWQGNLRHQMYIEGRLDSRLLINNIRITSSKQCSGVKSTRSFVTIRNSCLSGLLDEQNLDAGMRSDKVVDMASSGESSSTTTTWSARLPRNGGGPSNGLVFLRARRGMWGADSPACPDVSFDPPRSSVRPDSRRRDSPPDLRHSSIRSSGGSFGRTTPPIRRIPYTFKKYIAYNRFRWIRERPTSVPAFRDDGTAPREAAFQGSTAEIWGTVPQGWSRPQRQLLCQQSL